MIDYLRGDIVSLSPTNMTVECGGVGYDVVISLNTYQNYQGKDKGKVWITQIIRDDAHLLFGFASKDERLLFGQLTTVSGVGPSTARLILSAYAPQELAAIISTGQSEALKAVKGIGLKTAQRIIVDLKGKLDPQELAADISPQSAAGHAALGQATAMEEANSALKMLGFADAAIKKALQKILAEAPNTPVEELIKKALRLL